jgi:predicted esterase
MGALWTQHRMNTPIKVQPKEKATASLIFLHGLGDTGHGWAEQFRELSLKHIRCICPHASMKPVTLNGGMIMPSWFDIKGLDPNSPEDEEGVKAASKELQSLVNKEISEGIPADRIIIGGFSQGGCVALYTAFGTDIQVAGVLALSTWLPLNKHFLDDSMPKYNRDVPMLQCHGPFDSVVSHRWGKASHDIIKSFNPSAQFMSYTDMYHCSSPEEMQDVKAFLEKVLRNS